MLRQAIPTGGGIPTRRTGICLKIKDRYVLKYNRTKNITELQFNCSMYSSYKMLRTFLPDAFVPVVVAATAFATICPCTCGAQVVCLP